MINKILSLSIAVLCVYLVSGALMQSREKTAQKVDTAEKISPDAKQMPVTNHTKEAPTQPPEKKPLAIRSDANPANSSSEGKAVGVKKDEGVPAVPAETKASVKALPPPHSPVSNSVNVRQSFHPSSPQSADTAALLEDIEQYTNH